MYYILYNRNRRSPGEFLEFPCVGATCCICRRSCNAAYNGLERIEWISYCSGRVITDMICRMRRERNVRNAPRKQYNNTTLPYSMPRPSSLPEVSAEILLYVHCGCSFLSPVQSFRRRRHRNDSHHQLPAVDVIQHLQVRRLLCSSHSCSVAWPLAVESSCMHGLNPRRRRRCASGELPCTAAGGFGILEPRHCSTQPPPYSTESGSFS